MLRTTIATQSTAIFAALLYTGTASAATFVGPSASPVGIDGLSITHSGGTELFNVRFDERSFNDAFGSTPTLTFSSEAAIAAALNTVSDFLDIPSSTDVGAIAPYDGTSNSRLRFPAEFDTTNVTQHFEVKRTPAGWDTAELQSLLSDRTQSYPDQSDATTAWVTFTPVPEPTSLALLGLGGMTLLWRFAGQPITHKRTNLGLADVSHKTGK